MRWLNVSLWKNKKKDNRGGFRENAKRPLKYGEETVMYRVWVPKSKKNMIAGLVKSALKKFEVKKE